MGAVERNEEGSSQLRPQRHAPRAPSLSAPARPHWLSPQPRPTPPSAIGRTPLLSRAPPSGSRCDWLVIPLPLAPRPIRAK